MEIAKKEQSKAVSSSGSKLRYPLRSNRSKAAIGDLPDSSSVSRRVRPSSSVSESVGALDLSAKEKSAKPPRRLSIPTKSNFSPHQRSIGSITPISEVRQNRSNVQGKSDTPLSEASKYAGKQKFNVLSSISYWLTQIKLSESACNHSVSLGFFKLALESGCEPMQRIREELKSYVCKYNLLTEDEEAVKDLLQNYNILEQVQQLKLSENSPGLQEEGISGSKQGGKLKPKSLIASALTVKESKKKGFSEKRLPTSNDRALNMKNQRHPVSEKMQKPRKVELNSKKEAETMSREEVLHEDKQDKENMSMDGAMLKEQILTS